jgi:hypothetical protein
MMPAVKALFHSSKPICEMSFYLSHFFSPNFRWNAGEIGFCPLRIVGVVARRDICSLIRVLVGAQSEKPGFKVAAFTCQPEVLDHTVLYSRSADPRSVIVIHELDFSIESSVLENCQSNRQRNRKTIIFSSGRAIDLDDRIAHRPQHYPIFVLANPEVNQVCY